MASLAPARRAALDIVSERRRRGAFVRELLRSSPSMNLLSSADKALATRLVLGSVSAEGELDLCIDSHLRGRTNFEPRARDALRLAAFELLYMDTAAAIVVDQGVELVRCVTPRLAGLANAVLRRIAEVDVPALEKAKARLNVELNPQDMARVSALPEWLCWELASSLSAENARAFAQEALTPPAVFVAANTLRRSVHETRELLKVQGFVPHTTALDSCFKLDAPQGLATSGLVSNVDVIPSDLAAQTVALLAAPPSHTRALEVGQGRGTKTILLNLATRAKGETAEFVCIDSDASKVKRTRERLLRAGLTSGIASLAFDATKLGSNELAPVLSGSFETVFVDAPCSGTGTMRRHVETPWSLEPSRLDVNNTDSLPYLQLELLKAASCRVKTHGTLIYSTCSALKIENEQVVDAFLASNEGACFEVVPCTEAPALCSMGDKGRSFIAERVTEEGYFRSHLDTSGSDAHFLARLKRCS